VSTHTALCVATRRPSDHRRAAEAAPGLERRVEPLRTDLPIHATHGAHQLLPLVLVRDQVAREEDGLHCTRVTRVRPAGPQPG